MLDKVYSYLNKKKNRRPKGRDSNYVSRCYEGGLPHAKGKIWITIDGDLFGV